MTASATTTSTSSRTRHRTPVVAVTATAALLLSTAILALALCPRPSMASATARALGPAARRSSSSSPHAPAYIGSWAASPLLRRGSGSTRLGSSRLTQQQQPPRAGPRAFVSQGRRASSMRRVAGTGLREDLTRLWGTISNTTRVSQVGF